MFKCPVCESDLHWENDFNYDDFEENGGDGSVLVYTCSNDSCDADMVHIYVKN